MTKLMIRFALALLMALPIDLQLSISPASAQQPVQDNLWITNENVRTSVIAGNTLYLGGDFTHVGPATGHAVSIDAASGTVDASFPKTNGDVYSIVSDNNGGWYVGGEFSNIGGANINNLAHIRPDKTVDPAFTPNPNNIVRTVAVSGATAYVGGNFTVISGQPRNRLAAVNATTGKVLAWNPNPVAADSSNTVVLALAISGDVVYVGGVFSTIGGLPQNGLAAINAATGQAVASWVPVRTFSDASSIVASGSTIYAGVSANNPDGSLSYYLEALQPLTGQTQWEFVGGAARALALSGSTLYAAGAFPPVPFPDGPPNRANYFHFVIALNAATGSRISSFDPLPDYVVYGLAVSGNTVYLGGAFTQINGFIDGSGRYVGGTPRNRLVAVDGTTGQALPWDPNAADYVYTLAMNGSAVMAGGRFNSIGGINQRFIVGLDLTTGQPTNFNPDINGSVTAMASDGTNIYLFGGFNRFAGAPREYGAAFNIATGQATNFNPPREVNGIASYKGIAVDASRVYVGGDFLGFRVPKPGGITVGVGRSNLAAFDKVTGGLTSWDPGATSRVGAARTRPCCGGSRVTSPGPARTAISTPTSSTPCGL